MQDSLGIREFFADDRIFGVEDVMPARAYPRASVVVRVRGPIRSHASTRELDPHSFFSS